MAAPTTPAVSLVLPPLEGVIDALRDDAGPIIELQLALRLGQPETDLEPLRAAIFEAPLIDEAFASQNDDGSWGTGEDPRRRVLSTLWMAKALGELGVDDSHPGWHRAAEFLAGVTHTRSGVLGLDGRDASVLSCYAGIAGEMYLLGGRPDLARPQIDWILRYQDVRVGGVPSRPTPAATWHPDLKTRYGGCLADTTCLIGLVKTGRALLAWNERESDADTAKLVATMREAYLERRLMYRANGEIVPIGIAAGSPDRWLQPTFPLDWHTDLIEVLDFVARSGPPDLRMLPAIDQLSSAQLAEGTWPLRLSYRPPFLPAPERRSQRRGSPMITLRVVSALTACATRPA